MLVEGDIFPEIMFRTIDDEILKTEDLKGKLVFYNFYFAACPPCIAQKDGLNELYENSRTVRNRFSSAIQRELSNKAEK